MRVVLFRFHSDAIPEIGRSCRRPKELTRESTCGVTLRSETDKRYENSAFPELHFLEYDLARLFSEAFKGLLSVQESLHIAISHVLAGRKQWDHGHAELSNAGVIAEAVHRISLYYQYESRQREPRKQMKPLKLRRVPKSEVKQFNFERKESGWLLGSGIQPFSICGYDGHSGFPTSSARIN